MHLKLLLFALVGVVSFSIEPIYGQLHGGHNQAPPIDFGGIKVAVSSNVSPEDFTLEQSKSANLAIRFFDSDTNTNIKSVTYRVQIFNDGNLLANEYFFDEDGKLDLEIKPKSGCIEEQLWKCTKYLGEKHPIAGAYYARGDNRPIIQGPIFDKGGVYNVKVDIVGATNPKTMTATDIHFETFVIIPLQHIFQIKAANAQEFPITIRSFDGKVENFQFDNSVSKFSYQIPFDWSKDVHQASEIRQHIVIRKELDSFREGANIDAYLDGIKLPHNYVMLDTISDLNSNIIKINVPHDELAKIHENLGTVHTKSQEMKFEIKSSGISKINSVNFAYENGYKAKISWDSKYSASEKIPFTFSFYDNNGNPLKEILYAYSVTNSNGNEILSNIGVSDKLIGIKALSGVNYETFSVPTEGKYSIKLILTGQGSSNFDKFISSKSDIEISSKNTLQELPRQISLPSWIKNNAGWWSAGTINDSDFAQGIQYLIKEKIILIPETKQTVPNVSQKIPDWVKNNAAWWSEGKIDDQSFVLAIQYLVEQGIIRV